ncbi:MAG: AbrB/MazE/SpoVT family DNA-binding domain-containing protein [Thermoplasmata archaeon]
MVERCPACGKGVLRPARVHEEMFGVDLGVYDGEVCDRCGESFLTGKSMDQVEARAKELGLWGLATKVKVVRSGNSLVVRIPSPLARYLKLRSGQEVLVAPDKGRRLVLELA